MNKTSTFPAQDAAPAASTPTPATPTMWNRLKSPFYLFGKGPSIALLHLLILCLIASIGASLMATIIGLLLFPLVAIFYAEFERWRLAKLGYDVRNNHVPMSTSDLLGWAKFRLSEVATWRETGSLLALVIFGSFTSIIFILELALWASFLGAGISLLFGITNTGWYYSMQQQLNAELTSDYGSTPWVTLPNLNPGMWWIFLLVALLLIPIFAYLNGILVAASASLSAKILAPSADEYEHQVSRLAESRTKIVDAFETERRRIERDLHDGVQQELVNINMRLGLAELEAKKLGNQDTTNPVLEHVAAARAQLAQAQQTLRNTVRGIYPAVLEEHGLQAALEELAHNCAVPTRLSYYAKGRFAPEIERTAYFAASEGLTNALKHADASEIGLDVRETVEGYLQVTITDNGTGGADPNQGTGLAGLGERAQALGGSFSINSVAGSTSLQMRLPIS